MCERLGESRDGNADSRRRQEREVRVFRFLFKHLDLDVSPESHEEDTILVLSENLGTADLVANLRDGMMVTKFRKTMNLTNQ